ncbi:hypothetical protein [Halospeciosus flavus]|uniref:Secreted protein n=1 Tax=Halospeciosus flavus TaxID=3032283 RepID=A0ABD5Z1K4_9EURY|nr:hypothetical protein [Halospeciosus flavus]
MKKLAIALVVAMSLTGLTGVAAAGHGAQSQDCAKGHLNPAGAGHDDVDTGIYPGPDDCSDKSLDDSTVLPDSVPYDQPIIDD